MNRTQQVSASAKHNLGSPVENRGLGVVALLLGLALCWGPGRAFAQRPVGIDVSYWQGPGINWANVKNSGVSFAWAKATEGVGYNDIYFGINITNARAAGVLIGAYHFARYDLNFGTAGADAEAAYFWGRVRNYIQGSGEYLMPVLDVEWAPGNSYSKTTLSQWVNRWCQQIVNLAAASNVVVRPVVYTGVSFANTWLDNSVTNWPLWMANYNGLNPQTGAPSGTGPWPAWNVWQYTSTGSVPGVSGNCDMNVFNGTMAGVMTMLVIGGGSNIPPSIATQPVNASVPTNGTASFTVVAQGTPPLSYQWQKNSNNLVNGGHYSGATSDTLTITGADLNDVASYRCVVTNAHGSVISSNASLTLIVTCEPNLLVNGDFEGPDTGGLAHGWTGYRRAPNPASTVWSIQTASPPAGGTRYQQIANSSSTGGGGVRQDITGCTIGATYRISGWMRGNSGAYSTCTVKCSPGASTNWATAIHLSPPQTYTGSAWTPFTGTVVATAHTMTLWLDGQTTGTSEFKAECFDSVTVTCAEPPAPLRFESVTRPAPHQTRLVLTGRSNSPVTILRSVNLVNWTPWTNLVNTHGTVQVTDTTATNEGIFYRAWQP